VFCSLARLYAAYGTIQYETISLHTRYTGISTALYQYGAVSVGRRISTAPYQYGAVLVYGTVSVRWRISTAPYQYGAVSVRRRISTALYQYGAVSVQHRISMRHELAPLMVLQFNAARKAGELSALQRTGRAQCAQGETRRHEAGHAIVTCITL
jgi:hypothetical protein